MKDGNIEFILGHIGIKIEKFMKRKKNIKSFNSRFKLYFKECKRINMNESEITFEFIMINKTFYMKIIGKCKIISEDMNEFIITLKNSTILSIIEKGSIIYMLNRIIIRKCLDFTRDRIEEKGFTFEKYDEILISQKLNDEYFEKEFEKVVILNGNEDLMI